MEVKKAQTAVVSIESVQSACIKFIFNQLIDELSVIATSGLKYRLTDYLDDIHRALTTSTSNINELADLFAATDNLRQCSKLSSMPRVDQEQLKTQLEAIANNLKSLKADIKALEADFVDDIEDTKIICKAEEKMIDNWESAQIAQAEMLHSDRLQAIQSECDRKMRDSSIEQMAAECIDVYKLVKIEKIDEKIEEWNRKYSNDLRNVGVEEQMLDEAVAELRAERLRCEKLLVERQRVIEAWQNIE